MIIFQLRTLKNILLDVKWGDSGFESEKVGRSTDSSKYGSIDRAGQPTTMMLSIDPFELWIVLLIFLTFQFLFHVPQKSICSFNSSYEIGRNSMDGVVVLDILNGPSSYNYPTKLDQLLNRYMYVDNYI